MTRRRASVVVVFLLMCIYPASVDAQAEGFGAVLGGLLTWFGIPFFLSFLGFGRTIAARSFAAALMSFTTRMGVGTGMVSTLQSIGAAGVSWPTVIAGCLLGAGIGYWIRRWKEQVDLNRRWQEQVELNLRQQEETEKKKAD